MKKKAKTSNRNRHTGRVNAFKAEILERGQKHNVLDGTIYRSLLVGSNLSGRTLVRDFAAEHDAAIGRAKSERRAVA